MTGTAGEGRNTGKHRTKQARLMATDRWALILRNCQAVVCGLQCVEI